LRTAMIRPSIGLLQNAKARAIMSSSCTITAVAVDCRARFVLAEASALKVRGIEFDADGRCVSRAYLSRGRTVGPVSRPFVLLQASRPIDLRQALLGWFVSLRISGR
jgi:hypothetical protein